VKKLLLSLLYCIAFSSSAHALNTQTLPILDSLSHFEVEKEKKRTMPELDTDGFVDVDQGSMRSSLDPEIDIPEMDEISVYVVSQGDTVQSIAKLFNVTSNTIIWANDLRKKSISVGDTLVILPINGIRHIVKKDDTLKKIAAIYKADVGDIELFNGVTQNTLLAVGQTILVPEGEIAEPKKEIKKSAAKKKPTTLALKSAVKVGYYIRPTNGLRTQGIHGRNAVDIASPIGTPVRASAEGTVILAKIGGWNGGYGNYVVIRHPNGTQTLYAHLSVLYVNNGQVVTQGETIAGTGNSGRSTGPHLHFEIRNGPINPF